MTSSILPQICSGNCMKNGLEGTPEDAEKLVERLEMAGARTKRGQERVHFTCP